MAYASKGSSPGGKGGTGSPPACRMLKRSRSAEDAAIEPL
jgi:hypothetical protein